MTCFYATPIMYAPMMHGTPMCGSPIYYRRTSPCGASPFLFALLAFLFLPTIVHVAACLLHIAFHVVVHVAFVGVAMKLLHACASCGNDASMTDSAYTKACAMKKACFAKMKAAAMEASECTPRGSATDSGTVREELAKEAAGKDAPLRRHDLSSGSIEATTDGVRLIVAAPGVKPDDLEVTFVDQTLHIKGETVRGADVYSVETQWTAPRTIDLSTAHCSHIDGALTITLKKKAAKRIPVSAEVLKVVTESIDKEVEETEGAAGKSEFEGWEPLETKPLEEKKDA